MDIVIDFDGTCVAHEYPRIGADIGAIPVLKEVIANGHRLVLYTMRHDHELDLAVKWFEDNDIELFGVQANPTQHRWTGSPKAYGQLYIDDCGLGCPTKFTEEHGRIVDWEKVREMLIDLRIIRK